MSACSLLVPCSSFSYVLMCIFQVGFESESNYNGHYGRKIDRLGEKYLEKHLEKRTRSSEYSEN